MKTITISIPTQLVLIRNSKTQKMKKIPQMKSEYQTIKYRLQDGEKVPQKNSQKMSRTNQQSHLLVS